MSLTSSRKPALTRPKTIAVGLILTAVASASVIWWIVALPVLSGANQDAHAEHFGYVFAHTVGGTLMLFVGALALYVGVTKQFFRFHAWIGRAYLTGGAAGAGLGLALSFMKPHPLPGVEVATGVLALAWLAVAGMAYRAARNKRFESHRQWMTRSYVLTWTFVFCRMIMHLPMAASADPATIVAIIWASWITPLIVCEIALQWGAGARVAASGN